MELRDLETEDNNVDLGKEYLEHKVFDLLDEIKEFYKDLSFSVYQFGKLGIYGMGNIDSYMFSSMQGTMESIRIILKSGHVNDAYSLLRKFHDCIMINVYSTLFLEDNFSMEMLVVKQIDDWLKGNEKIPSFKKMNKYIQRSTKLEEINSLLSEEDRYKNIRESCNNNTHYNFYKNVLLNCSDIRIENRHRHLDMLEYDIEQLFIFHLSYLFIQSEHYMTSSDYMDYLEMGMEPEEDSQYWVSNAAQNVFDKYIKSIRPDIAELNLAHTCMKLV